MLAAARNIGRHMEGFKVVVDKSTVPVGTADRVRGDRPARAAGARRRRGGGDLTVVSNPEFLKEGAAVEDFMRPDRIVIGVDDDAAGRRGLQAMKLLYAPFNRQRDRTLVMGVRSAEFTKYAANAMLATRISFMNELANLADRVGADIDAVRHGIGSDPRIGYGFLYAGTGYGGSCFPKDVKALRRTAQEHGGDLQGAGRGRGGERGAEAGPGGQDRRPLRRGARRPYLRSLGPRVQAEHRRHARGAEPGRRRRAAEARRVSAPVRSGRARARPASPSSPTSPGSRRRWPA